MKRLLFIFFILSSTNSFCQIQSDKSWSLSIQRDFDLLTKQNIDTFLVYYTYLGPWTNLPKSYNGIPSVWVLWKKNNKCFARNLICDSVTTNNTKIISSRSFDYFLSHKKDFKFRDRFYSMFRKEHKFLPPIPTDGSWEYLYFMTTKSHIYLNLSEHQRTDDIWKEYKWIKPTIDVIDVTKTEFNNTKTESPRP